MSVAPAIAFVVPAYNATRTLEQTLRAIVAQTMPPWEAVVVDDGSEDDPGAVVERIADPRIRLWRQPNAGLSGARNSGYARTTAPAVCFLDADDLIDPEFAAAMLLRLEGADAAACAYRMIGPCGEDLRWVVRPGEHDVSVDRLLEMNPLGVGGVVLRRSAAERTRAGMPLFDPTLPVVEDWDLWLRLSRAGGVWAIEPRPLFWCRQAPGSLSRGLERMWRTGRLVLERHGSAPAALRRWSLRLLARAVAAGDTVLIPAVIQETGPLTPDDAGTLVGALREAFCRENRIGPEDARAHQQVWRDQIISLLPDAVFAGQIAARTDWETDRWGTIARAAAARLGPEDTLVVYGAGLNGRAVLAALDTLGVSGAVIDDHPAASITTARLSLNQLTRRHLVLVTPEERHAILARLRAAGVERILLPEELLRDAGDARPGHGAAGSTVGQARPSCSRTECESPSSATLHRMTG